MAEVLEKIYQNEEERKLILREYRKLLRTLPPSATKEDRDNVRRAFELAVQAHAQQRRKSGDPYILHPIEVARICAEEIGLGPTAIVAALLHDVVEDTDVSLDDIRKEFGERIARLVDGLTKLDHTYDSESPQAENFRKVLSFLVEDVRVVLIKIADRLHNMRTLGAMPRHKQLKIASETSYIYAPLAHRLGLYSIKSELEDLCLKVTEPKAYQEIARKLRETKEERNQYIKRFIEPIKRKLDETGFKYRILGRPKSISSIYNKIRTKRVSFEQIYDLFAVRIILDVPREREKAACWEAYSVVTDVYRPLPERLKDWVSNPKSNGYESLHTTVIGPDGKYVEVQIRTERMDEVAEKGFAAHWKYKGINSSSSSVFEVWLDEVRELLENKDADAREFIHDFKTNLFTQEVYVTTPKGEVKVLPKGATALDFAFHIHTEVGYHCRAVKVNQRIVPLGYKLQNGDQVEVLTDQRQKPNRDWLRLVVTGKARARIRRALNEERRRQSEMGREALQRKLANLKVDDFLQAVDTLVRYYGYASHMDLYYAIATEQVEINALLADFEVKDHKLVPRQEPADEVGAAPAEQAQNRKVAERRPSRAGLLIDGEPAEHYNYTFAACCNPVQGDDIFAFISRNGGLKIHRANCPNATHLMANYDYRIRRAEWVTTSNTEFVAELKITGIDDGPGVIERLSHELSSKLRVNIRSFSIEGREGYFEGTIKLLVSNVNQLNLAIRTLQHLDNVSSVVRVR